MPSQRFRLLRKNVNKLRKLLLPSKFSPTGVYTASMRVSMRALSFRVLAHAEIETYFEERAIEISKTAWNSWKNNRHSSCVILHLLGYSGQTIGIPPDSLQPPPNKNGRKWSDEESSIKDRLERSVTKYIYNVSHQNHGIKEKNILSIVLPLGFDVGKCDQLTLTTLDQFGSERGAAAHSSALGAVTQLVDPQNEFSKVRGIIEELMPFDAEFDRLLLLATK